LEKFAIIVAGGQGSRMNSDIPKQFIEIHGEPILVHTIRKFRQADSYTKVILVLPTEHMNLWEDIAKKFSINDVEVTEGGPTRFDSVSKGLALIKARKGVVAVHDAVRPCISEDVINRAYHVAMEKSSAIVCVPSKDSLRIKQGDRTSSVDRSQFLLVQTPQVFHLELIRRAYDAAQNSNYTDDAAVVENIGEIVEVVTGDYSNLKVTTPEDLILAEAFLK
jgi:2-C-methyl-D-erythritol 4-phosphate cytidylyltransferase